MNRIYDNDNEMQPLQHGNGQNTIHDQHAEAGQRTLDQDHMQAYKQAAARLEKIYNDPQHYLHEKPVSRAGHTTKQYKNRLINQCRLPWAHGRKHQWEPHRSGFQCHTCQTRVHQALTVEVIELRLKEDCELLAASDHPTAASPGS